MEATTPPPRVGVLCCAAGGGGGGLSEVSRVRPRVPHLQRNPQHAAERGRGVAASQTPPPPWTAPSEGAVGV